MALLPGTREQHRYQTCDDEYCDRFGFRVYKEGYAAGFGAGYAEGRADGYADGYGDGYSDGSSPE